MATYKVMVQRRFGGKEEQKGYPVLVLHIVITSEDDDHPAGRWSVTDAKSKRLITVHKGQCLWAGTGLSLYQGTVDKKTVDLTNGRVLKNVPDGVVDKLTDDYDPGIQLAAFDAKPHPVATQHRTVLLAKAFDAKAGLSGSVLVWWTDELKKKEEGSK